MNRRATKLAAVYLLLGLVATWAVALVASAVDSPQRVGGWPLAAPERKDPNVCYTLRQSLVTERVEFVGATYGSLAGAIPESDRVPLSDLSGSILAGPLPLREGSPVRMIVAVESIGWPLRALRCEIIGDVWTESAEVIDNFRVGPPYQTKGGARLSPPSQALSSQRVVPLTTYWPGLLADTAFYALLFAGLHQLATWGRRARRRKRGNCAACGYDLTGLNSATCPECGHTP